MVTRLLVVRHGESEWNALGRYQGWADPPLSAAGREQAARAAPSVRGLVTRIVCSDLKRASETADIIAAKVGLRARRDAGVRERDVGEWTGLTRDEILERWPDVADIWGSGGLADPAGAEPREAFDARVIAALERIASEDVDTLVVTHGGAIRAVERGVGAEPGAIGNLCAQWLVAASPLALDGPRYSLI